MRDEEKDQRARLGLPRLALGAPSGVLAGFAALVVAEAVAAAMRPQSGPVVTGAIAGALLLYVLVDRPTGVRRSPTSKSMTEEAGDGLPGPAGRDRRGFVLAAASAAATSAVVGAVGRSLNGSRGQGAIASRTKVVLPNPRSPARPVPEAGTAMIADVAWAQYRGIDEAEVRIDDAPWQQAHLAAEDTRDTWRQRLALRRRDRGPTLPSPTTKALSPLRDPSFHNPRTQPHRAAPFHRRT
ncbi:hypothetical protein [Streptomyces sp. NPDC058751]|uniref:hypothetical protein n=1 Tax=Streptomyces sp. NPDC058751 TaxID=3346623 RepID=UPI00368C1E20